jgi:hypothetical protein
MRINNEKGFDFFLVRQQRDAATPKEYREPLVGHLRRHLIATNLGFSRSKGTLQWDGFSRAAPVPPIIAKTLKSIRLLLTAERDELPEALRAIHDKAPKALRTGPWSAVEALAKDWRELRHSAGRRAAERKERCPAWREDLGGGWTAHNAATLRQLRQMGIAGANCLANRRTSERYRAAFKSGDMGFLQLAHRGETVVTLALIGRDRSVDEVSWCASVRQDAVQPLAELVRRRRFILDRDTLLAVGLLPDFVPDAYPASRVDTYDGTAEVWVRPGAVRVRLEQHDGGIRWLAVTRDSGCIDVRDSEHLDTAAALLHLLATLPPEAASRFQAALTQDAT